MDRQPPPLPEPGVRKPWFGLLILLGLFTWQGWMTLTLFGPGDPWHRLLDDQPIVSGTHALHLYHGFLGAESLYERGTLCCYDPAFQAGYPKTPVFDSGSRPAELFLALEGGHYRPAAYKIGLACCCCLVPLLLLLPAQGVGLGMGGCCLSVALGLVVWWGSSAREALEAGDLNLLLAALACVAYTGLLIRFHRAPGEACWIGLLLTSWLGWFSQPALFVLLLPLLLVYYFTVGARHGLVWHAALLAAFAAGLAANAFWLVDYGLSWWIRLPLQFDTEPLAHRTFRTIWCAALWGGPSDRLLVLFLMSLAGIGVCLLNFSRQRLTARLLTLGAAGSFALAVTGVAGGPLGRLGTAQMLVPSLWFATVPAAYALVAAHRLASRWTGHGWRGNALLGGPLLALAIGGHSLTLPLASRCIRTTPLAIGLGAGRQALIETLKASTTSEARILWEDHSGQHDASHWTALLPVLTGRVYLGGLDPDCVIEHAYADLVDQALAGRPVDDWTDLELEDYCRHYNVGWVVCWAPASAARFRAWNGVEKEVPIADAAPGTLFTLRPRSFILAGQADLVCADRERIALANVVPQDGKVVLSLHYQAGMQASPGRVQVEREPDPYDPIPFVRLRMPGPVARVTITWGDR